MKNIKEIIKKLLKEQTTKEYKFVKCMGSKIKSSTSIVKCKTECVKACGPQDSGCKTLTNQMGNDGKARLGFICKGDSPQPNEGKLKELQLEVELEEGKKKKKKKKKAKRDACYHKVKARYDVWPSAYASGALVKCRKVGAKNWGKTTTKEDYQLEEKWSKKYKDSIDCNNPKGFSQKAHCAGKKKRLEEKRKLTKKPSSETSLRDWFKRKGAKGSTGGWVDCNAPDGKGGYKSCGRKSGEKRSKYPACRPTPSACKSKGKGKKWGKKSKNEALDYHLDRKIPINECVFRHGSEGHLKFINEARNFAKETRYPFNLIERSILRSDLGKYGIYEGEKVPLDLPMINEAEYRGKKVELNKPKRGGSKKFYVYTKNKKGNVVKVSFGDTTGLKAKINNPGAVKSFVARHKCKETKDRTKASYWSCRLPRYAKSLGLSGGGQWW